MNACLITGGLLSVLIATAHSYLGERFILTRLFRQSVIPQLFGSDAFTRQTLRFSWHLTSLAWVGLGGILVGGTMTDPLRSRVTSLQIVSLTFFISAIITGLATRGRHLAWIVFLAISLAAWFGSG